MPSGGLRRNILDPRPDQLVEDFVNMPKRTSVAWRWRSRCPRQLQPYDLSELRNPSDFSDDFGDLTDDLSDGISPVPPS